MTPSKTHGFALVIVMWGIALLMLIATSFAATERVNRAHTSNFLDEARAAALAEAGFVYAMATLLGHKSTQRWRAHGERLQFNLEGGRVEIVLAAEQAKIDLNQAPRALLSGLARQLWPSEDDPQRPGRIVSAILDWRDDNHLRSPLGAEDAEYALAGLTHGAADRPFLTLSELTRVIGVGAVNKQHTVSLTVHSGSEKIDPRIAPLAVLYALPGVDRTRVERYAAKRGADTSVSPDLTAIPDELSPARTFLTLRPPTIFTVNVVATTVHGFVARVQAVIQVMGRTGEPFRILAWSDRVIDGDRI